MIHSINEYPFILTTKDVQNILECSYPTALKIMNDKGFPLLKVSGKKMVKREHFFKWLDNQVGVTK